MAEAGWQELTQRETGVLAAVERRLTNAEIAAELHISVRTVESHIASLRRKLAADSRTKLMTVARDRRGAVLQLPRNSFVGRDDDLAAVRSLLDRRRWVTVVGAAGCGKTRLALEVAAAGDRVPVVVELEHAGATDVVSVVAKAIGLGTDSKADLVSACGLALEAQSYLLVIDNCDRVTEAVGELVSRLLTLAGNVFVLATSRSPVGRSDETIHQLHPLPVVGRAETAAARLFLDRAASAEPTVALADTDGELVAGICRRLDGLPLAIELAAARVRHLPLAELAAQLEHGFALLDRVGPPSRHRTLEAAFDWTWDLLDDEERTVLSRLGALPRTFDLELAEAVTTPGAGRIVLRLLDRSLVTPAPKVTTPRRFRLLESLREFVVERLSSDEVHEVRRAHAAHHAGLADRVRVRARTDDSRTAGDQAKRLCPELNSAVDWALIHQPELALRLACTLAVGGEQYGPDLDSMRSITRAARDPRVRELASATDLFDLGAALCYGDLDLVAELAELALDLSDDQRSALAAHHLAGSADAYRQRGRSALAHLEVAERLADELLDMWHLASVQQVKGIALRTRELDDPEAALAEFESAMHTFALAGDAMHVNNARYMMAQTAAETGIQLHKATAWVDQCAAYARRSGNRHELAHAMLVRAALSPDASDDSGLREAVRRFQVVGDLRCLTRGYLLLAGRCSGRDRISLLEQGLAVARTAHDIDRQTITLERLINAHWESRSHHDAAVALGALVNLVGRETAKRGCPAAMVAELGGWDASVAEGQARAPKLDPAADRSGGHLSLKAATAVVRRDRDRR